MQHTEGGGRKKKKKGQKKSFSPPRPKRIQQAGGSPLKQPNASIQGIGNTQRFFWQERLMNPQSKQDKSDWAGIWACMLDCPHLLSLTKAEIKLSLRLAKVSRVWTLSTRNNGRIQNPPFPGHKWRWIFCSCYSLLWQDALGDVYPEDIVNSAATQ